MHQPFLSYLITDPKYYTHDEKKFEEKLTSVLNSSKIDMACFRDKTSKNFEELASVFVKTCNAFKIKTILINGNYEVASKLHATGVHLTSSQFADIPNALEKNLFVIISCHTFEEIKEAQRLKANAVTFSPIFDTPNKGPAKGIELLKQASSLFDLNIIALGGIMNHAQIALLKKTQASGFASIRYFVKGVTPLL